MRFKKIISGLTASLMVLTSAFLPGTNNHIISNITAVAETSEKTYSEELRSANFGYKKVDENNDGIYDYITITDYYDTSPVEIILPDTIDDLSVKGIENFAFWRIENKLSIIIPESLDADYLGQYAFITAAVTYQSAVKKSESDTLEGFIRYCIKNYDLNYSDESIDKAIKRTDDIVKNTERDIDFDTLSLSQYLNILFDEIISGKAQVSDEKISQCQLYVNYFSYAKVGIISYFDSNVKDYVSSKPALKYTKLDLSYAGISIGNAEADQGNSTVNVNMSLNNTASNGCEVYVYCDAPLKILEISNAVSSEFSSEYGSSCIHATFAPTGNTPLKDNISSLKIAVPENIAPGTYPIHIQIVNMTNEKGTVIKKPVAKNGLVTIKKSIVTTTKPIVTTTTESTSITSLITTALSTSNNTETTTVPITTSAVANKSDTFKWGKDNWSFSNNSTSILKHNMNNNYSDTLRKNMTNTEWANICEYINKEWTDSSYGMSVSAILAKKGLLPFDSYTKNASSLNDLDAPINNSEVNSLVSYYNFLQAKKNIQQSELKTMTASNEENIRNIISQIQAEPEVLICYQKSGWGKHSVIAYNITYGTWEKNCAVYNGRIDVFDPDTASAYDQDRCIYFDTKTFNWEIPAFTEEKISSLNGAKFTLILSDINNINNGGFIAGTTYENSDDFYAKMIINSAGEDCEISKNSETENNTQTNNTDKIIPEVFYGLTGHSKEAKGYILKDSQSGYKLNQKNPDVLNAKINYENSVLEAYTDKGSEIIFDPSEYICISGNNTQYILNMIFDKNYPTDWEWHQINVSGFDADNVSLNKIENGYIMYGNSLSNVTIKTNNDSSNAQFNFSTVYKNVFIYETDEKTIGVSIDKNNDGVYETPLHEGANELIGDISGNGEIDLPDAVEIAKYILGTRKFTDEEFNIADYNQDGEVDLQDAVAIAKYILKTLKNK